MPDGLTTLGALLGGGAAAWAALEIGLRAALAWPLRTGFYGSVRREEARSLQERQGVRAARGPGWLHLGWIADPERERYRVERFEEGTWRPCGRARTGSWLGARGGRLRVQAEPLRGGASRTVGELEAAPEPGSAPLCRPEIAGPWRPLFRPRRHGRYVNDHTVFRDAAGRFRLLGITSHSDGDFAAERWFAQGVSGSFPPAQPMQEAEPVAERGGLAWAPHVVEAGGRYHLFWSPHRLQRMSSSDGVRWEEPRTVLDPPRHRFFRDAMVLEVAPGQWLLYATGRGRFFSRVDLYQSFDLERWQYLRPALRCGLGSERNSAFASTESPTVFEHHGRWYLALTYTNDTCFLHALGLRLRRWPFPARYHDTRVFQAPSPYDFGVYRGARRPSAQVARLEAHAAEVLRHPETGQWWITTAGWPWAATLTSGEVAVAPLRWQCGDALGSRAGSGPA